MAALHKLLGTILVGSLLAACATPPAGPITGVDREAPHALVLDQVPASVRVDGDTGYAVPGFVATSPAGLIGGLIGQAIVHAVEAPAAQRRTERKRMLEGSLGDTAAPAAAFAASFDAALEQTLREVPGLTLRPVPPAGTVANKAPDEARIAVMRDAILSADARMVVGRARVIHYGLTPPSPRERPRVRHFLYFSEPVAASGDAHATVLWQEEGGRLMRARLDEAARGLAAMVRAQLFEDPQIETKNLSTIRVATSGAEVLGASYVSSSARPPRLAEVSRAFLLRRDAERAVVLHVPMNEVMDWVWISVPASSLPAPGS